MKNRSSILLLTSLLFGLNATATPLTWNGTAGGDWNTTDAWLDGVTPATWNSATPDSAIFGSTGAGTVNLTAGTTTAGITFDTAGYTIAGSTLTLSNSTVTANADATISSALAGATGLIKAGSGKLTISGANTYTGGSTISAGTLQINAASASGTITLNDANTADSNTTLNINASVANAITVANQGSGIGTSTISYVVAGTAWNGVTMTLDRAATFSAPSCNNTWAPSSMAFAGSGTLTIGSINNRLFIPLGVSSTFTGDIVLQSGSAFEPRGIFATANGNNLTIESGGIMNIINFGDTTINALNGSGTIRGRNGIGTLTVGIGNGSGAFSGTMQNNGIVWLLAKAGTGTQELSGANINRTGATTLTNGTLKLTQTTAWSSDVTMDNANAVNLQLNAPNSGDSWTYAKKVLGGSTAAKIEKTGLGTVTLSPAASSSFVGSSTGALTVTGGKLYLNSAFTTAPSVSVASGSTIGGTSTVGAVTVANGGTLEGGSGGTGTLTAGDVALGSSGTDSFTLKGTLSTTAGYKALSVANLVINGGNQSVTLDASGSGLTTGTYYDLLESATPITAPNATSVLASLKSTSRAYTPAVDITGTKIQLFYDANASVYWTGANGTAWNTAATNWKLTGNNADTQFLANDVVIFNDSPANSTVDISTGDVAPNSTIFNNTAATAYTLQGTNGIAAGSLAKNNAGTLTILNANSYSSGTTIHAGRVRVGNNAALGSGAITFAGGALSSDGATARSLSNAIVLGANAVLGDTTDNGDLTLGGAISGTGFGLIKEGAGTLTLSGASSFTGGTTVNAGTLATTNWNTATLGGGANPAVSVGNGASLSISGTVEVTNNATITLPQGSTLNLSSVGQGNGKLFKAIDVTGDATINLAHTGTTAGSRGNGFILKSSAPVNVTVNGHTTGDSNGAGWMIGGAFFGVGATETASLAAGSAVTFNGSGTADGVNLTLGWTDPGSTALQDTDLVIGDTAGTAGVLVSLSGSAGRTCQLGSLAGGTGALTTIVSDSFAGILQINHGTVTGANFAGAIKNGAAGGTVSVVKNGTGTQIFSGANTYTGTTTVNGGTLALVGGSQTSPISVNNAGTSLGFTLGSGTTSTSTVTFGAGTTVKITGTPTEASYTLMTASLITGTPVLSSPIAGYSLTVTGGNTLVLAQSTGYSAWANSKGLDGTNNGALDDPNHNGISNIMEYVLNGEPLLGESPNAILPTLDASGSNFVFTFTRRVESAGDTTQIFEYGSDLSGWTPLNITAPTDAAVTLGTPTGGTPDLQTVTVTVAKGANTTMFGRLKAIQP